METFTKLRFDILVEAPYRNRLTEQIEKFGVTGYTIFPALAGLGDHGHWSRSGLISNVGKMELLVCIIDPGRQDELLDMLQSNLSDHIGYITTSPVNVIRKGKFT